MNYITTTDLRTKSSDLVRTLKKGGSVSLVHRSKIIGEIKPKNEAKVMTKERIARLKQLASELNLPNLTYEEREKRYRAAMMEKHGKHLS